MSSAEPTYDRITDEQDISLIRDRVLWETPRVNQGQIIEVSYGSRGARRLKRVEDRSEPVGSHNRIVYYNARSRRVSAAR